MIAPILADVRRTFQRRGLVLSAVLVPLAIAAAYIVILVVLNRRDAQAHPSVGGTELLDFVSLIAVVAMIFGTIIGASLGAEDHANGTLRYLLLTGVSRLRLYLYRLPAVVILPVIAALPAVILLIIGAAVLAHPAGQAIGGGDVVQQLRALVVAVVPYALIAYAIGVAIRSSGGAIALALGMNLVGFSLLGSLTLLVPAAKKWVLPHALDALAGSAGAASGVALAALVAAIWIGAFLAAGALRALRTEA